MKTRRNRINIRINESSTLGDIEHAQYQLNALQELKTKKSFGPESAELELEDKVNSLQRQNRYNRLAIANEFIAGNWAAAVSIANAVFSNEKAALNAQLEILAIQHKRFNEATIKFSLASKI